MVNRAGNRKKSPIVVNSLQRELYRHWAIELGSFGSEKLLTLADNMLWCMVNRRVNRDSWPLLFNLNLISAWLVTCNAPWHHYWHRRNDCSHDSMIDSMIQMILPEMELETVCKNALWPCLIFRSGFNCPCCVIRNIALFVTMETPSVTPLSKYNPGHINCVRTLLPMSQFTCLNLRLSLPSMLSEPILVM